MPVRWEAPCPQPLINAGEPDDRQRPCPGNEPSRFSLATACRVLVGIGPCRDVRTGAFRSGNWEVGHEEARVVDRGWLGFRGHGATGGGGHRRPPLLPRGSLTSV